MKSLPRCRSTRLRPTEANCTCSAERSDPSPRRRRSGSTTRRCCLCLNYGSLMLRSGNPSLYFILQTSVWRKLAGPAATTETLRRRNIREQKNGALGPRGRRGHSTHALKDCLLVYGGYKDFRGSTNELWAFHYGKRGRHEVINHVTPRYKTIDHHPISIASTPAVIIHSTVSLNSK